MGDSQRHKGKHCRICKFLFWLYIFHTSDNSLFILLNLTPFTLWTQDTKRFRIRSHNYLAPDPFIVPYLEYTGFGHVIKISNCTIDSKFILAMLERWRPETHRFHLPIGECTVTLEDVYMLLGLPVDGKAVNGSVQQPNSQFEELLGRDMVEGGGARGHGICDTPNLFKC